MPKLPETFRLPGAIDIHVHLREPSDNKSETIESGTLAARFGGWAAVVDMPNNPGNPTWTWDALFEKQTLIRHTANVPTATWAGSQPNSNNIGQLEFMLPFCVGTKFYAAQTTGNHIDYEAGDFEEIADELMELDINKPIALHAGKDNLEDFIGVVAQDRGMKLHVCHVNDPEDVEIISEAKHDDLKVTCGVCPHHLLMNDEDVKRLNSYAMMQPPLARKHDREKLVHQFNNGEIDIIETDHAPHSIEAKEAANHGHVECFGVPSLEFALPLLLRECHEGRMDFDRFVEGISRKPAGIIGVEVTSNSYTKWRREEFEITREDVVSACNWTPYVGQRALGRLMLSVVRGWPLVLDGKLKAVLPRLLTPGKAI